MKKIKLTQNKYTFVDDDDFGFLSEYRWFYHHTNTAMTNINNK